MGRQRRPEILRMLSAEVYGIAPDTRVETSYRTVEEEREALDGAATRRQVRITLRTDAGEEHTADMLLYIPNGADAPVPVIFGLNFKGNHGTTTDPAVIMPAEPKSSTTVAPARRQRPPLALCRGRGSRICRSDDMQGRLLPRPPRRICPERAADALPQQPDPRLGADEGRRGVGVGHKPRHRLSGDDAGDRPAPHHGSGALASGQDVALGRSHRPPHSHRRLERLGIDGRSPRTRQPRRDRKRI